MPSDVFDDRGREMAKRSEAWKRTSDRPGCVMVICPDCGRRGLIGGAWTASCAYHVSCHVCGFVCVERSIDRHLLRSHGITELTADQQQVRELRRRNRSRRPT